LAVAFDGPSPALDAASFIDIQWLMYGTKRFSTDRKHHMRVHCHITS
jgi:hypothetical protein